MKWHLPACVTGPPGNETPRASMGVSLWTVKDKGAVGKGTWGRAPGPDGLEHSGLCKGPALAWRASVPSLGGRWCGAVGGRSGLPVAMGAAGGLSVWGMWGCAHVLPGPLWGCRKAHRARNPGWEWTPPSTASSPVPSAQSVDTVGTFFRGRLV